MSIADEVDEKSEQQATWLLRPEDDAERLVEWLGANPAAISGRIGRMGAVRSLLERRLPEEPKTLRFAYENAFELAERTNGISRSSKRTYAWLMRHAARAAVGGEVAGFEKIKPSGRPKGSRNSKRPSTAIRESEQSRTWRESRQRQHEREERLDGAFAQMEAALASLARRLEEQAPAAAEPPSPEEQVVEALKTTLERWPALRVHLLGPLAEAAKAIAGGGG